MVYGIPYKNIIKRYGAWSTIARTKDMIYDIGIAA